MAARKVAEESGGLPTPAMQRAGRGNGARCPCAPKSKSAVSLWSAVRELESLLRETHEPVDLDLHRQDEATRQILFDHVVWGYFTPRALDDPGDITVPRYTPEECGLRVYFEHGRWFVTWLQLEKDRSQPEAERVELLLFEKDKNGHLVLAEV